MTRAQVLDRIGQTGSALQLECVSVRYHFHFRCDALAIEGRGLYEIGRNDAGIAIVADGQSGHVYFWDGSRLSFINSSFQQMLDAIRILQERRIPGDLPDEERAARFEALMLANDPAALHDPASCWSSMREEIANGIL